MKHVKIVPTRERFVRGGFLARPDSSNAGSPQPEGNWNTTVVGGGPIRARWGAVRRVLHVSIPGSTRGTVATWSAMAIAVAATGTWTDDLGAQRLELTGNVAAETRLFPEAPLFPGQESTHFSPSLTLEPEFLYEWSDGGWRLTGTGFIRLDAHDSGRTHADVRELGLVRMGNRFTAFAGIGKVFWGVTEVRHLVDIVNQTDAVEDVDDEDKLGQPMLTVTLDSDWGSLDVFYLPWFRERTFQAANGRLRGPLPVDGEATYEAKAGRGHADFALRWARPAGAFDLGVSFFRGTSREPRLLPVTDPEAGATLRPHYDLIDQVGVDLQWTGDATLLKFEGISRGGHGRRFFAATAGIEHTLYQIFSTSGDLGLLTEAMIDGRGSEAPPTVFDNDVFVGIRWALNDVAGTAVLGGPVVDFETGEVIAVVEAERRFGAQWRLEGEARFFANARAGQPIAALRRDGFLTLRLSRFF